MKTRLTLTLLTLILAAFFTACAPNSGSDYSNPVGSLPNDAPQSEASAQGEIYPQNEGYEGYNQKFVDIDEVGIAPEQGVSLETITGSSSTASDPSVNINNGESGFSDDNIGRAVAINNENGWIALSELDESKRAGRAISLIDDNTLPTEKRTQLNYKPSGWQNAKVDIEGKSIWFYNRSHLIAFSLSGLNNEKRNLITGAVKMNSPTMSKFEMEVLDFVRQTDNVVLYEVTPMYNDGELVARGVQIRYVSIDLGEEDDRDIETNVYLFNANPGYIIDYRTGSFQAA